MLISWNSTITKLINLIGLSANNITNSSFLNRLLPDRVLWKPLGFTISITTKCNLKCTMCARTVHEIKGVNMSRELFLEASSYFDNKVITILGNGEPLLHPDFFEFLDICTSRKAKINIVTNGTLLTEDKAERLLLYPNLLSITFSIDGVGDNYDRIRKGSSFKTVVNNLIYISRLRKTNKLKTPSLSINFVGMKSNIDDFPKLIEELGCYVDIVELSHPIIFSKDEVSEHLNENIEHAEDIFRKSRDIAKLCGTKLILRSLSPYCGGCIEPWTSPYIGINGDVYYCCMVGGGDPLDEIAEFYGDESLIRKIPSLGKVSDLGNIWNGSDYRDIRKKLAAVNVSYLRKNYKGNLIYSKMLTESSSSTFYCKICPYRWHCAC